MFEDDPKAALDDMYGYFYPNETHVPADVDAQMDLQKKRHQKSWRQRWNIQDPDDVFKKLLPNTFEASKTK